ncbi:mitogen-activated protein kinase-binding protein 1-like isoform X3 [Mya arenaria]|uniref:mitogen-activated protein kinase-binding protein 1-like isoform X3 n=1 Tax=Mya arenaria TaxID=6604 RepID=UPI0022E12BF8|nr:mitogen-activated protein kinase-binding protein 1-like isoform X3 [Mya arenaria]
MENKHPRRILKSPVAKRRSRLVPKDQKVVLERVLGLTASSNATFACDPNTGTLAYPAGCVVVLYNPKKNKQGHIFNVSKKNITSLAFSGDGKHLVTGESGHQPAVRVWDVAEKTQVAEFLGHKFGIICVAFSPNLKYIVSIGTMHDMQVCVWNWRTGSKVASNKVSSKVSSVAFSADGSYFVTVGTRHVKFWYLDSSKSKINETVPLNGRNGILGDQRNNFFCDVATGTGSQEKSTFCVTQSGFLCQFNEKRQMDRWVELRTTIANCISASSRYIYAGCANGVVRVFSAKTLEYVATLPKPHYLGNDIAAPRNDRQGILNDKKYPDTIAIAFDEEHSKVTCIYNDHSVYVWDVHDLKKIGKAWSFLYHSSCVYGVEVYPMLEEGKTPILPPNSFITCSSDDTIRIWNLDPHMAETKTYKNNIYSHEYGCIDLLKIMYMDPSLASLCDVDYNPSGATDKTDTNYDDKNGIRSIRVSPDGQHLASGDRQGNVRIHDLENLIEIKQIEAHESEVLSLEYSHWKPGPSLLSSSSRDRLIHVFDTEQQYGLLQTLSDHSSSISAVRFTHTDDQLKMISCGADKSILFRNLQQDPEFQFTLATHQVEKMTLYDMVVDPEHTVAAIACQDRNVRVYNIKNGKKKKEYKGSLGDEGTLVRMSLDPSGSYLATSCSDKNICLLDFASGDLQATMFGHSEFSTDVKFMNDLRHLITTSGDGCIFVWRLPQEMTSQMHNKMADTGQALAHISNGLPRPMPVTSLQHDIPDFAPGVRAFDSPEKLLLKMSGGLPAVEEGEVVGGFVSPDKILNPKAAEEGDVSSPAQDGPDSRSSIASLPSWVKKHMGMENVPDCDEEEKDGSSQAPRGRWAQRGETQNVVLKQQDGRSVSVNEDRRRFSYEADTVLGQADLRRDTMVIDRPTNMPKNMPVIEDEDMEEEDLFMGSRTFVKPDTNRDITWDDLYNFDNDADVAAENEIIYYPPSESDGSDGLASSYQVFNKAHRQHRKSLSGSSIPDGDSESGDVVSLEDMDEEEDSTPSTPLDDVQARINNREKFLKDTFENLSFTPVVDTEKFRRGLDNLEEELDGGGAGNAAINHRQSLSARFLSRSQAAGARGQYGGITRQDNWFDSVQRRKDDMARNLDESRKMLMAMGWKQESPDTDNEDPFAHPSVIPTSPPQSPQVDPTKPPSPLTGAGQQLPSPSPSPRTPKTLRRCWSSFELPKSPIPEIVSVTNPETKPSNPKRLQRSASSCSVSSRGSKEGVSTTPTSSRGAPSQPRPRTLPLDKAGGRVTPTERAGGRTSGPTSRLYTKKDLPYTPTASSRISGEVRKKTSRFSAPLEVKDDSAPALRRSSYGSNLNKSHSKSLHSLTFDEDELELTPQGANRRPRSKWGAKLSTFGSVPDLLQPEKDGKKSSETSSVDSGRSEPDINDNVVKQSDQKEKKTYTRKSLSTSQSKPSDLGSKRAASSRSLAPSRSISVEEKNGPLKSVSVSMTNLTSTTSKKTTKDRDLMPPPAVPGSKARPNRAAKRADPRRRTTDNSGFSLEEAKDILSGKSSKIVEIKEKAKQKRSTSISPSRNSHGNPLDLEVKKTTDINDFISSADTGVLLASTEIELTAAEMRRKSAPGSSTGLPLEAYPNDPPERDVAPESSKSRTRATKTANTSKSVNPVVDSVKHKTEHSKSNSDSGDNSPRLSEHSNDNDGECPSPSVKDRIARLNKHVTQTGRQSSTSPYRGQGRPTSPTDSPRQTSAVQINLSSSLDNTVASPSSVTSCNTQSLLTVSADSPRLLPSITPEVTGSQDMEIETSPLSASTQSTFPAAVHTPSANMAASPESDTLMGALSPGNHSNSSPRSVADTGLGSDTDLDSSQSFRRYQLSQPSLSACKEQFYQTFSSVERFTEMVSGLRSRGEDVKDLQNQCCHLASSLRSAVGLEPPTDHLTGLLTTLTDRLTSMEHRMEHRMTCMEEKIDALSGNAVSHK